MSRSTQGRRCRAVASCATALLLAISGCGAPVKVVPTDEAEWFSRHQRTALDGDQPSERAAEFLRREGLLDAYYSDRTALLESLHQRLLSRCERMVAVHIAELAYLEAKRRRGDDRRESRLLASCIEHAWAALFDTALAPEPNAFDPAFRLCCDLYNRAAARLLKLSVLHRNEPATGPLEVVGGELRVRFEHSDFDWDPRSYEDLAIAYDLELVGLPRAARGYGIGVPANVTRRVTTRDGDAASGTALVSNTYAATVLLRIEGSILSRRESAERIADVEVFDPLRTAAIRVGAVDVPLEVDLSCSLAYSLGREEKVSGIAALFDPSEHESITGLLMLQPWDPAKIPVVFVHGLMSAPITWTPLLNDLLADPAIRSRFQFWFFRYPTGNPVLHSASLLRRALKENVARLDPEGRNEPLKNMVLVGHSMGGLLSRVQVRSSENRIWDLLSDRPFEEVVAGMKLDPDQVELLREALFFERLPFIRRVVFMAVPHRGAEMATSWYAKLGASLISLPKKVAGVATSFVAATSSGIGGLLRGELGSDKSATALTGVGSLAPDNKVATAIADWPFPDDLPVHSIIGNEDGHEPAGSDGLVAYSSSHLEGVVSELIVHSGHNVQVTPEAALELRRILLLHLGQPPDGAAPPPPPSTPSGVDPSARRAGE